MRMVACTPAWLLVLGSTLPARAQDTPPAAAAPEASADASATAEEHPQLTATLLLLQADWSKAATAQQIEQDLQTALQDVPLGGDQRENLAARGPEILFAPEHLYVYRPADFHSLLAWLEQHDLIKHRIDAEIPVRTAAFQADDETTLRLGPDLLPVRDWLEPPPPFVQRRLEWRWRFFSGTVDSLMVPVPSTEAIAPDPTEITVSAFRRLANVEEYVGQPTPPGWTTNLDNARFTVSFPGDRVAVLNAFPGSYSKWQQLRQSARELGVDAIIILRETSLAAAAAEPRPEEPGALRIVEQIRPFRTGRSPARASTPPDFSRASLKVVSLQYVPAKTAASIVAQLFGRDRLSAVPDERINTLILRGDETVLAEVEALLLRLDEEPDRDATLRSATGGPGKLPDVQAQALRYRELESQALQTAAELQQLRAASRNSLPQLADLTNRLRQQVAAAFDARQQWQRAELEQLRARLAAVAQTIQTRETIRETVIDRRVDELLNPNLRWDPGPAEGTAAKPTEDLQTRVTPPGRDELPAAEPIQDRQSQVLKQHLLKLSQARVDALHGEYKRGQRQSAELVAAHADLLDARLSAAVTTEARREALLEHRAALKELHQIVATRRELALVPPAEVLAVEAALLKAEQQLARETETSSNTPEDLP